VRVGVHFGLPRSPVGKRGQNGDTGFYRDRTCSIRSRKFISSDGEPLVELLARGNQTVVPPSIHPDTGEPYRYLGEATLENTRLEDLPEIPADIAARSQVLEPWLKKPRRPAPVRSVANPCELSARAIERQRRYCEAILERDLGALAAMGRNTGRNNATFRLVCRLGR